MDGPEQAPQPIGLHVLRARAGIMFSGNTGTVVASGEPGIMSAPSFQLVDDIISVIKEQPSELFDPNAEHRPCGLLDKYTAIAQLLGDVLGLLPMPWTLGEPVGKAAAKLPVVMMSEAKKARKAAKRKGQSAEEADAAVRRSQVKLQLPTAAEIQAAWRTLARAAEQPQRRRQSWSRSRSHRRRQIRLHRHRCLRRHRHPSHHHRLVRCWRVVFYS